ncbi:MAG: SPOR domain-containing protein [Bacteroidales bacterium]|jgi:hypothetical protein|nr:SPOR domain-containing protein [Bacteroidales bacterium]
MKNRLLSLAIFILTPIVMAAQESFSVLEIMNEGRTINEQEKLIINQDPALDTLISRHIMANAMKKGVDGWRIQIYRGGHRTANDDANKVRAKFMEDFPDVKTYLTFDRPNWFKVKVGDYRTREEAATIFFTVQAKYPEAYLIRDVIAFTSSEK